MSALRQLGAALRGSSLENPGTPLTGSRLLSEVTTPGEMWPGADDDAGDPLGVGSALRCVQILASTVAGCPLRVRDRETREDVRIGALTMERAGTTPLELWETVVAHLALWGNAYLRKVRTRDGRIVALVPIHPSRVHVDVVAAQVVGLPYAKRFDIDGGRVAPLTEFDVLHIPAMSVNGVTGLSVVGRMRRTFGLATHAERMADRLYERGMLLSGFLTTEQSLDGDKAEVLKERWRAKLAGVDNAYEVAVLDKGTKFEQLSMSPADAQFLETRKFQTTEIARLFGVPGWIINDQEKTTSWGTGMEQQFISFVIVTLKPYMQRIEQRITREVCDPAAEKAEFAVEGLLRGDSKARAAFYASGIQHGWLVPNEPRELEDLQPVAWGDQPYRPYNKSASDTDDPTDAPGGDDDDTDA